MDKAGNKVFQVGCAIMVLGILLIPLFMAVGCVVSALKSAL